MGKRIYLPAVMPLRQKTLQQIYGERQDDSRIVFRGYFNEALQKSEVHGRRLFCHHPGCVRESLRGLELAFGVNDLRTPLSLRLRLLGHGALHLLGKIDVLDFHQNHFHSPGLSVKIQDLLNSGIDFFSLS